MVSCSITAGEDKSADLNALMEQLTNDRSELDDDINDLNKKIDTLDKSMKMNSEKRAAAKATYDDLHAELSKGIKDLGASLRSTAKEIGDVVDADNFRENMETVDGLVMQQAGLQGTLNGIGGGGGELWADTKPALYSCTMTRQNRTLVRRIRGPMFRDSQR